MLTLSLFLIQYDRATVGVVLTELLTELLAGINF
ncbi:MAG: hypothetical protein PWP56_2021 [Acetobacterium sp.]|nr:hypothetical protein [Acetobacterium sp.]